MRSYDHFIHLSSHIIQKLEKLWTQNISLLEGSLENCAEKASSPALSAFQLLEWSLLISFRASLSISHLLSSVNSKKNIFFIPPSLVFLPLSERNITLTVIFFLFCESRAF